MFRTAPLSIIRSLFTIHSAMVYVIQVCRHMQLLSVQWINSWWSTDGLSEKCRVSCQNKFVKLVHLVGFIIKKKASTFVHHQVRAIAKTNGKQLLYWRIVCVVSLLLCGWVTGFHGLLRKLVLFLCTLLFGVELHSWFFCKHLFGTYVLSVFFYCDFMCCIFNALLFFLFDLVDDVVWGVSICS
jgi:hypothetical protein